MPSKVRLNDGQRLACRELYDIAEDLSLGGVTSDAQMLTLKDAPAATRTALAGSEEGSLEVPLWLPEKYRVDDPSHPDYHSFLSSPDKE
ncbi:MAG: hypothetical protein M1840_002084 [Geoglossum simile]|nr:MAG: hypothetical protein M1840_002084 [Geoglossum simile]